MPDIPNSSESLTAITTTELNELRTWYSKVSHSLITRGDEIGYIFLHKYFHFSCTGEQGKNSFVTHAIATSSFFSGSCV